MGISCEQEQVSQYSLLRRNVLKIFMLSTILPKLQILSVMIAMTRSEKKMSRNVSTGATYKVQFSNFIKDRNNQDGHAKSVKGCASCSHMP